ncbi:Major facilitator superfamily transporter [Apiospora kogelbergensis]|uniref:Major facilitator superfamily transporter n=1 Tax=Apiospora kogelbergensis TaxID=1337665 RepID=A0AAW0R014_9PEZI
MAEQHDAVDGAREDTATTPSEATPLLQSNADSRRASSASSSSTAILRDVDTSNHAGPHQQQQQRKQAAADNDDEANYKVSRGRGLAIMISVYILIFLQSCNMSGMTMAQSTIAADLDAYEDAMWFTSAYLIALSSLAPLTGRLASIFSPRLMVLVASLFFAAGGLVTAVARSFGVFILGRVLSGMGGSAIMVLAFILVLELTSRRRRGLFVGMVNAGFTTGISLGAVVFGVMIPNAGWRALFAVQVPAGLIAGLGVYFAIPKSFSSGQGGKEATVKEKLKKIDYLGAVVLTGTIVLFLYSLSAQIQIVPLAISAGSLVLFVLIEYFVASDPIIPISVLQNRGALLSCLAQLGFMTARWTILFYAPITALAVFGLSPGASGSMLIPTNLGFGLGGILIGWVHIRRAGSFYLACLVCVALFAATMFALSLCSSLAVPGGLYVALLFANGVFTGATVNYTLAHLLHLTSVDTHYVATSLLGTFRGFAGSFGSAIGGGIFIRTLRASLEEGFRAVDGGGSLLTPERAQLIKRLIGSPALVYSGGLGEVDRQVAVQGYVDAIKVLFQAAAVLSVVVLIVQASTGWRGPGDALGDPEEEAGRRRFDGVVPREGEELDD